MKLAASTFSFSDEWIGGELTLPDLLRRLTESGSPTGVEVIGAQLWRDFPRLAQEEILAFRRLLDELELEPAAIGVYVDLFRRSDRSLTPKEALGELAAQIATAAALGFPVARLHSGVPLDVLERAAPLAEEAGVAVAIEIQGEQRPDDPGVASLLELVERLDSPGLGLVLDFSISMRRIPSTFTDALLAAGFPRATLEDAVARWEEGAPTADVLRALGNAGAPVALLDLRRSGFARFGRQDPEAWRPHIPRIAHVHAKFWELDASGSDPSVRDAELIAVLRHGEYGGFVCSEWGGNAWLDADEVDAFALTAQHLGHLLRLIERTSPVPA
ncbi:MAG: TIM barrel protein [Thermoleophilia bacterium]|nr:TIM barrel protein [Thermoleophilia bacterium]